MGGFPSDQQLQSLKIFSKTDISFEKFINLFQIFGRIRKIQIFVFFDVYYLHTHQNQRKRNILMNLAINMEHLKSNKTVVADGKTDTD